MAISNVEEDLEGPRVLGIGLGLFILILLWSFSLVGSLLLSRLSSGISTAIILGAGTIYGPIVVDNIMFLSIKMSMCKDLFTTEILFS